MPIDWEQIRREHGATVWRVAWRILRHHTDALECSQDAFAEAARRSQTSQIDNWGGFLRWLATRRAIDMLRRRREQAQLSSAAELECSEQNCPQAAVEFEELVQIVRQRLATLPQPQAEAFWLVCVEQWSYRETAEQMQIKPGAVGVLVHRARQQLKDGLRDLVADWADRT